jgi:hypothetical protein
MWVLDWMLGVNYEDIRLQRIIVVFLVITRFGNERC